MLLFKIKWYEQDKYKQRKKSDENDGRSGPCGNVNRRLRRYGFVTQGKPAEGNVWSTPTLAEQTIAGVYNQLYVDYSDVANGWFDIWSSTMDYGIGIAPTFNFLFATNSPSSVKGSSAPWQRFYKGIIKANDVIGNLPTVEGFDETKRSRYISECMFSALLVVLQAEYLV